MEGFKKIGQSGGSYIVATFFNPETLEVITKCVRDYDYADCSRDDDELYYMPIDEAAKRAYLRMNGIIQAGDTIEVVKGRKVPVGTVAKVVKVQPWYDRYGRQQSTYAYLDNGMRTAVGNCKIIDQQSK